MAIRENDAPNPSEAPRPSAESAFAGATLNTSGSAPQGAHDFLSLMSMAGATRIDAAVQPYLDRVLKGVKEQVQDVTMDQLQRTENAFAFIHAGKDGRDHVFVIQFVSGADPIHPDLIPLSFKFRAIQEEIQEKYRTSKPFRIDDMRIINTNYQPEMDRADTMAETITREFRTLANPVVKDASYQFFMGTEFSVSFNLSEAKALAAYLSPHGVPTRMEFAMTLNVKVKSEGGIRELRDLNSTFRPVGVIGGFMDIKGREQVFNPQLNRTELRWKPVFNITTLNSPLPLEAVGSILLAAFVPYIYHTTHWSQQWLNSLDMKRPQPGLLEKDPANTDQPLYINSREEMNEFIATFFDRPTVALQLRDGADMIPGMQLLASPAVEHRNMFIERLAKFFELNVDQIKVPLFGAKIEDRFDGVVGSMNGALVDSNEFDYLYFAAANGLGSMDENTSRILLGLANPTDRARIIQNLTGHGNFRPLYMNTVFGLNADYINFLVECCKSRGLTIIDPNSSADQRPLGSILEGFGNSNSVGQVVTHGIRGRSFGLGSVWG